MPNPARTFTAVAAAAAVIAVPTGSIAATPLPQATPQQASAAAATNPWLTLSAMSGNSSSASAAAAAAVQDVDRGPHFPDAAPLVVMLGTIALGVWILFKIDEGSKQDNVVDDVIDALVPTPQIPVSPA